MAGVAAGGERGTAGVRVRIHVKPGASRQRVGGSHDGALVVAVSARAVDGAATEAALTAVAEAFGLRRRQVRLVSGQTSREKVVELDLPAEPLARSAKPLARSAEPLDRPAESAVPAAGRRRHAAGTALAVQDRLTELLGS
jgi:uncharacterized protein (TIGR00251 family)